MNQKSPSRRFVPFENSTSSAALSELTIENGTERIALYGQLTITRDKQGLAMARALKEHVDAVVAALETADGASALPAQLPPEASAPKEFVDSPFKASRE